MKTANRSTYTIYISAFLLIILGSVLWPPGGVPPALADEPEEGGQASQPAAYTNYLPVVMADEKGVIATPMPTVEFTDELPGLKVAMPAGWAVAAPITSPITPTVEIAHYESYKFVSPDGDYSVILRGNYVQTPDTLPYGLYYIPIPGFTSTLETLPTGEQVQIQWTSKPIDSKSALFGHATFVAGGASYVLALYGPSDNPPNWELFWQMVLESTLNPDTMLELVPFVAPKRTVEKVTEPLPKVASNHSYDRVAALEYVSEYLNQWNNDNNCYVVGEKDNIDKLSCTTSDPGSAYVGLDGAHFVNREIYKGGIPVPTGNGTEVLNITQAFRIRALKGWLENPDNNVGIRVDTIEELEAGDLIFYGEGVDCWGWGGMLIDDVHLRVAFHSAGGYPGSTFYYNEIIDTNCPGTGNTINHFYFKILGNPQPKINAAATFEPANGFTGQEMQGTFTVCNYGDATFEVDAIQLLDLNSGASFFQAGPISLAPGGQDCYTYQELGYNTQPGNHNLVAGYWKDGEFNPFETVDGSPNGSPLYLADPDEIAVVGQIAITPDPAWAKDTLQLKVTVKNNSPVALTDNLRFRIYSQADLDPGSLLATLTPSGDINLSAGGTHTHQATWQMATADYYWVVAEHWAGGDWQPLAGESVRTVSVALLRLTESLTRTPADIFVNQQISVSYTACNYGTTAYNPTAFYVQTQAPAKDFPAANPPNLPGGQPGGCYTDTQTAAPFTQASQWVTIEAGFERDGQFYPFEPLTGVINSQDLYVAHPDEIAVVGQIEIAPNPIWPGDEASFSVIIRNNSPVTLTDNFRFRIYTQQTLDPASLVATLTPSGQITLAANEKYTYNATWQMDIADRYWVVAEHWAGGEWQPLAGESVRTLPVVLLYLRESLARNPQNIFITQPTTVTFEVCNYGTVAYNPDTFYVHTAVPGTHFPSVDPPNLPAGQPGGCYAYKQSGSPFPQSSTWYTLKAGFEREGQFYPFKPLNDTIVNAQDIYVAHPDEMPLIGDIQVTRKPPWPGYPDLIWAEDTAVITFTVKNISPVALADNFRLNLYDKDGNWVTGILTTGMTTINSQEERTFNFQKVLTTPGIYTLTLEHWAGHGNPWLPLAGNSSRIIRILYPIPELNKGLPPYSCPAGQSTLGGVELPLGPQTPQNPNPPSGPQPLEMQSLTGPQVNACNGNFIYQQTDTIIPLYGMPFEVSRYYNTLDASEQPGDFGYGWSWTFGWGTTWRDDKTALLTYPDGRLGYYLADLDEDDPFELSGDYPGWFAETEVLTLDDDGTGTFTDTDQIRYEFNPDGQLTSLFKIDQADDNLYGFIVNRDGNGRLTSIQQDSGGVVSTEQIFTVEYEGDYISRINLPEGYTLEYTTSPEGDLLSAANPAGDTTQYTYDDLHRMETVIDPNGNIVLTNEYDNLNRVVRQEDAAGYESTFNYLSETETVFTNRRGDETRYLSDDFGRLIEVEEANEAITTYTYDDDFNRTSQQDPEGGEWGWTYDTHGRLLTATNPNSATWTFTYDAWGNLIEKINPLGAVISYTYNNAHNLTQQQNPDGGGKNWTYPDDATSNEFVIIENDIFGQKQYSYLKENGLLEAVYETQNTPYDLAPVVKSLQYNLFGNMISFTDAEDRNITSQFDYAGRMLTTIGTLGQVITYTYDSNGNLLTESDGLGNIRHYTYDKRDLVTTYTDFAGNEWAREYDGLGHLVTEFDPGGGRVNYTYDAVGNLQTRREARGGIWRYAYDLNHRLTREIDPIGNEWNYTYDAAGNRIALERPCDNCPSSRVQEYFVYDSLGQLITHTNGRGYTTQKDYDLMGRVLTITNPLSGTTVYHYNLQGDLIEEIDALGHKTTYHYNLVGWLITKTNRLGYTTLRDYDRIGNVTSFQDERGNRTAYQYDAADRLIIETNPQDGLTRYEYDLKGNRLKKIDALDRVTEYKYDPNNNLIWLKNPRTYTTTYQYDAMNRVITETNALGGKTIKTYNFGGDLLTVTRPDGNDISYEYDALGQVTVYTNTLGYTTTYAYNAYGDIVTEIDALNNQINYLYDAERNLVKLTDATDGITTYAYDPLNNRTVMTDSMGGVWYTTYDLLSRTKSITNANGSSTTYIHNAEGYTKTITNPIGQSAGYEYDPTGNLIEEVDYTGTITSYAYNKLNWQTVITNPLSYTKTVIYDAVGNVITFTDFNNNVTSYQYNANNYIIIEINPLGEETCYNYNKLDEFIGTGCPPILPKNEPSLLKTLPGPQYTYDAVGNLISVTLPEGQVTTYTYDGEGNRLTETNANGETTTYTYDPLNRLIAATNPLSQVTRYEYDPLGRLIREIDANGHATIYTYNSLGKQLSVTDPTSATIEMTYDVVGNRLSETNANGETTAYAYDLLNRLIRKTDPLSHTWLYTYTTGNKPRQTQDANGTVIAYEYDMLRQLIGIDYPSPMTDVTYTYDGNGNLIAMTDGEGQTTYTYDSLDRLIKDVDTFGRETGYQYDSFGNEIGIHYPSGQTVSKVYNGNNWLVSMTTPQSGTTSYAYDPAGRLIQTDHPNSTWSTRQYDAAGRLLHIYNGTPYQPGLINAYTYILDAVGNRLQTVEQFRSGQIRTITTTTTYSPRDEVVNVVETYDGPPAYTILTTYQYDPARQRTQMTTNRTPGPRPQSEVYTTTYTYDAAGNLLIAGNISYSNDANGNRLEAFTLADPLPQSTLEKYQYDAAGRMVTYQRQNAQTGHVNMSVFNHYNGLGQRVAKGVQQSNGTLKWIEYTLHGLTTQQLVEYPQTGKPQIRELYRGYGNMLVSMNELQGNGDGTAYWFALDGTDNVVATTKHNGQSTHYFFYDPYHQLIDENGHWGDSSSWTDPHNHYLHNGLAWDEEATLYYVGPHFYDGKTGLKVGEKSMVVYPTILNPPLIDFFNPNWPIVVTEWGISLPLVGGSTISPISMGWQTSPPWLVIPGLENYLRLPVCRSAACQWQVEQVYNRQRGLGGSQYGIRQHQFPQGWLAEQWAVITWQHLARHSYGVAATPNASSVILNRLYQTQAK